MRSDLEKDGERHVEAPADTLGPGGEIDCKMVELIELAVRAEVEAMESCKPHLEPQLRVSSLPCFRCFLGARANLVD